MGKISYRNIYSGIVPRTAAFKFKTKEDHLFDRIMYIRSVLDNPDLYTDTPDINTLLCELFGLLGEYRDIIANKVDTNSLED